MDEATKLPIGPEEVAEAAQILQRYKAGKAALDKRLVDNELWFRMGHWKNYQNPMMEGKPQPSSGWLFNSIANKHADAMDNYPSPNVLPRAEDDEAAAQALSSVLPVVLEQADYEQVYSDTWWRKLKQGTGVKGVFWDSEQRGGVGEIAIRPMNLLMLYWEPGVDDIQTSPHFFSLSLADTAQLESRWPQLAGHTASVLDVPHYIHDGGLDTSDKSVVVDWYYKKPLPDGGTALHLIKFTGRDLLYASENDPAMAGGFYPHGQYPVVFDVLYPEAGTPCGFGMIAVSKDPQQYIDRLSGNLLEMSMKASTPRFWVKKGCGVNAQEFLDWSKPLVEVEGSIDDERLRQISLYNLDGQWVNMLQLKIDELKETSNSRDVTQGSVSGGVTAASAIAALQEASGRSSRAATRSAYRAYARMIRMVIERIRQFYDLPRKFRILGAGGAEEYVSYCNAHLKAQSLGADGLLRTPVFDVTVTTQKHTEYTKLAQNELALQFFQLGFFRPGMEQQALACLDMMDFDGKEQVLQKIRGGTQDALWQRMALTLAQRYEPELFASLTDSAQGMRADVRLEGEKAPAQVRQARKRAAEAAQPE